MPKTRTIVPLTHPKTGAPLAAGAEVELDDEAYNALRAQGAVEATAQEVAEHATETGQAGEYRARTTRGDAGQAVSSEEKSSEPEAKKK